MNVTINKENIYKSPSKLAKNIRKKLKKEKLKQKKIRHCEYLIIDNYLSFSISGFALISAIELKT